MPTLRRRSQPAPQPGITPFWDTPDGRHALFLGNVTDVLARLPAGSVQCCVTSPPYWGLRAYDTGDAKHHEIGAEPSPDCKTDGQAQCGRCFICSMVAVFREVRRVLRDDGVLWLNLGDTYSGGSRTSYDADPKWTGRGGKFRPGTVPGEGGQQGGSRNRDGSPGVRGLVGGNLVGVPWRVALALQADGWVLRSDVPWVKRSAMPESVRNRPAKALEYWFMLTKGMGYFFDMEAVKVRQSDVSLRRQQRGRCEGTKYVDDYAGQSAHKGQVAAPREHDPSRPVETSRNIRNADLWFQSVEAPYGMVGVGDELVGLDVTAKGYEGAHFATFAEKLIEPLIKAVTSERGACGKCGAPWDRVVDFAPSLACQGRGYTAGNGVLRNDGARPGTNQGGRRDTTGWQPTCECHGTFVKQVVRVQRPVSVERSAGQTGGAYAPPGQAPHSNARTTVGDRDRSLPSNRNGISGSLDGVPRETEEVEEEKWVYESLIPLSGHPVVACRVLDPFMGSGTTGAVCVALGRASWGIDLSETYLREHACKRIGQALLERNGPGELVDGPTERVEL